HRDELARLPPELLSPTLRAAVTAGWSSGATLRVTGGGGERGDRLQLALSYDVAGDRLPFETLLRARRAGQPFLVHRDRLVDLTDAALAWMDELGDDAVSGRGEEARVDLSALEYLRLRSHLEGPVTMTGPAEALRHLDELRSEPPAPASAS